MLFRLESPVMKDCKVRMVNAVMSFVWNCWFGFLMERKKCGVLIGW